MCLSRKHLLSMYPAQQGKSTCLQRGLVGELTVGRPTAVLPATQAAKQSRHAISTSIDGCSHFTAP